MMNRKAVAPLFVIAVIILIGLIAVGTISIGDITSDNTFVKPDWARLECAAEDYQTTYYKWLDQQNIFPCNVNTEKCSFKIERTNYHIDYDINIDNCDLNGNGCYRIKDWRAYEDGATDLPSIDSGRSYKFTASKIFGGESVTKITETWNAYKLFRFVGGSKTIVNSYDCSLKSGDLSKIRAEDYNSNILTRTGGEGQKWINYVNDWNYGLATNIVNYNGQEAYCSGAKVYSIVKLKMADGNLVKVNPDYSDATESGDKISGLGSVIANVECCPNEPNCGSNFKYTTADNSLKECYSDLQCYNAGGPVPTSSYAYVTYNCQSGQCTKSSEKKVECTNNAQCKNGQICDLSTMNYGKCITQKSGEYCGDGVCQVSESYDTCSKDCEFTCPPGETLVTETSGKFLGLFGTTTKRYCKAHATFWDVFGGWIIFALIIIALIIVWRTRIYKSIPYIGRYIP